MDKLVIIGHIAKTRGLQGELLVQCETDFPEHFAKNPFLLIGKDPHSVSPYPIDDMLWDGRQLRLWLQGIESREAAEKLSGQQIYLPQDQLEDLAANEFYLFELLNLHVFTRENQEIGVVVHVEEGGLYDFCHVETESGKIVMIPTLKQFMPVIDPQNQRILVDLPEGFLDL